MARLSALDALMLAMESPAAPLHVGSVIVLDGPEPSADELVAALSARWGDLPSLHRTLRARLGGLRRPVWQDDPDDGVAAHVRVARVAPPGGDPELRRAVTSVMASPVDLRRPPWEAWLITGLSGRRWGLALKAHHVMADGAIGASMMNALLDAPADLRDEPARGASAGPRRRGLVLQGLRTVVHPDLPECGLSARIGPRRTWGWVDLEPELLVSAARSHACTVNDVYLALLAGGYRSLLTSRGVDPSSAVLRTIVPTSLRARGVSTGGTNLDSAFFVDLPVQREAPLARLESVARQSREAKAAGVPEATGALLRAFGVVPQVVLAPAGRRYARRGQRRVNTAAPHVRGPREPATFAGRPVVAVLPYVPLALDVVTCCALLTFAGGAAVGITADADAVPDLDVLLDGVAGAALELLDRQAG